MNLRMINIATALTAALMLAALACPAHAQPGNVAGILERSVAVGGETPGWSIKLDEPVFLGGIAHDRIEVYSRDEDLSSLEGSHVRAGGTFVQWRTPERGKFIVLEICEIVGTAR